jgi:hypothetical protein
MTPVQARAGDSFVWQRWQKSFAQFTCPRTVVEGIPSGRHHKHAMTSSTKLGQVNL